MRRSHRPQYFASYPLILLLLFIVQTRASGINNFPLAPVIASAFPDSIPPDSIPPDSVAALDSTVWEDSLSPSALGSEVKYKAHDSTRFEVQTQQVHLYKDADITYENIHLKAAYIYIDYSKNTIYAEGVEDSLGNLVGSPVFTENGKEYRARKMTYNFKSKKGKSYEIVTEEAEGFVHVEEAKKDSFDVFYGRGAKYTSCDLDDPHFHVAISKVKIIPNKQIVTGPAVLKVANVPLPLGLPFGLFPNQNKRSSGIIIPEYGESRNDGFFFRSGGLFFALSDYVNVAFIGDIYTKGDYRLEFASNYAYRYHFRGGMSLNYAVRYAGERETPDFTITKQYNIRWNHNQDAKARPGTTFRANVNFGTSDYQRDNATEAQDILESQLNSAISYAKNWQGSPFSFTTSLSHNQSTRDNRMTLTLPTSNFSVSRINPFQKKNSVGDRKWYEDIGFSYNLDFRNEVVTSDTVLQDFTPAVFDDFNYGFRHSIPVSTNMNFLKYFTFQPSMTYTGYLYFDQGIQTRDTLLDTTLTVHEAGIHDIHEYSLNASLNTTLYGLFNINKGNVVAIQHVMRPNISLNYRPDFSQPKYGYYGTLLVSDTMEGVPYSYYERKVFGSPGSGQVGAVNFSLGNNLEMKVKTPKDTASSTKKIKLLEDFGFRSGYNLLADSMALAPFRFNARTTLLNKFSVDLSGTLNPYALNDNGFQTPQYLFDKTGHLARLTNLSISMGASLNNQAVAHSFDRVMPGQEDPLYYYPYEGYYADFNVPWNLSVRYVYNYFRPGFNASVTQNVNFNGELNITEKWKIAFRTDYNFTDKQVTFTSIDVYRDLHCWEMRFNWIPLGLRKSYFFTLKVRSSVLQDLKIDKRKNYRDYL